MSIKTEAVSPLLFTVLSTASFAHIIEALVEHHVNALSAGLWKSEKMSVA